MVNTASSSSPPQRIKSGKEKTTYYLFCLAHVGVALLNAVPSTQTGNSSSETSKDETTKSVKSKKPKPASEAGKALTLNGEGPSKSRAISRSDSARHSSGNCHLTAAEMQRQKLKKLMDELNAEGDGCRAPIIKLGDFSMASPFTAKHESVAPTTDIIRQGHNILVTTLQMFKILGLNCLAMAHVLSVMNLDGIKPGNVWATISGVFTAANFTHWYTIITNNSNHCLMCIRIVALSYPNHVYSCTFQQLFIQS
ncbi:hypothetical protein L1049_001521 [Liquidambar formosana]|uniref:Uncharacterized protein n=1 Tax=Liquidambar formosana TaxID=63359 RepID=A0AAP0R693_LIQFO